MVYECLYPKCGMKFSTRKIIRFHIRKAHGIKPIGTYQPNKGKIPSSITKYMKKV